jgi:hypothetical protein
MTIPVTSHYVVMVYNEDIGAFAPAFPSLDEAEEFSNAIRAVVGDKLAVAEPVPVIATESLKLKKPV